MILYVLFSTLMTFETTVPQLETRLIHFMQTGASDLSLQMVRKRPTLAANPVGFIAFES